MFCTKCGAQNDDNNFRCVQCAQLLHPDSTVVVVESHSAMFPSRNPSALRAYHLGVCALIPVLGIFLGPAAFIFGRKGLRVARENPQLRGKIRAQVEIIRGGLCSVGQQLLVVLIISLSQSSP